MRVTFMLITLVKIGNVLIHYVYQFPLLKKKNECHSFKTTNFQVYIALLHPRLPGKVI